MSPGPCAADHSPLILPVQPVFNPLYYPLIYYVFHKYVYEKVTGSVKILAKVNIKMSSQMHTDYALLSYFWKVLPIFLLHYLLRDWSEADYLVDSLPHSAPDGFCCTWHHHSTFWPYRCIPPGSTVPFATSYYSFFIVEIFRSSLLLLFDFLHIGVDDFWIWGEMILEKWSKKSAWAWGPVHMRLVTAVWRRPQNSVFPHDSTDFGLPNDSDL